MGRIAPGVSLSCTTFALNLWLSCSRIGTSSVLDLQQIGQEIWNMNLRKSNRYVLSCPAQYQWVSAEGLTQNSSGITRDVGIGGVFVRADRSPPVGAKVELSIALPNCEDTGTGMRLRGEGKVLRVDQQSAACSGGFAVSVRLDASSS